MTDKPARPRKLILTGDVARQSACRIIAAAPDGWLFSVFPPSKRRIQEEKYHAMISDIAKQVEFMGSMRSEEVWKRLLIAAYVQVARENATAEGKYDPFKGKGEILPSIDGKSFVQMGVSSATFTIPQASEFIEYLFSYGEVNHIRWSETGLYRDAA